MAEITDEVQRFLDRYITSIDSLEVLLLLQRHTDRQWTADAVAAELRLSATAADSHMAKLFSFNLLDVEIGKDLFYRYNPRPQHLERAAQAVATAYDAQPVMVIKLVLERPPQPIRDFAEAFRFTKKDDSDG